jgi:hypothetical protein
LIQPRSNFAQKLRRIRPVFFMRPKDKHSIRTLQKILLVRLHAASFAASSRSP